MTITNILFYLLAIAGIGMGISALLMLILALLNFIKLAPAINRLKDQILEVLSNTMQLGLVVFLFSVGGLSLQFAVEGINAGAYHLNFNKSWRGALTHILWKEKPARFVFQTILYIGISAWIVYVLIKMIQNKNKKNSIK